MTDAPDKHERRSTLPVIVLCVLIVLPLLYVLSMGPVLFLMEDDYVSRKTWVSVYYPVLWMSNNSDTFHRMLVQYLLVFEHLNDWYHSSDPQH